MTDVYFLDCFSKWSEFPGEIMLQWFSRFSLFAVLNLVEHDQTRVNSLNVMFILESKSKLKTFSIVSLAIIALFPHRGNVPFCI